MSAQTRKARAKHITVTKGRLRGRGVYRQIVGHENDPARIRELKARLKRAQTATVKPKGRLPNPGGSWWLRRDGQNVVIYPDAASAARLLKFYRAEFPDHTWTIKRASAAKTRKTKASLARNGFFDSDAVARAKKVKRIHKVQERNTKEGGEIIGVQPGGFIKVKWDNRERPTLIKRSEIKRYPYVRNPGSTVRRNVWTVRLWDSHDGTTLADIEVLARTAKEAKDEAKKEWNRDPLHRTNRPKGQLRAEADHVANPGIMELAGGLQALDYLGEKVGVGKRRRNPVRKIEVERALTEYKDAERQHGPNASVTQAFFSRYYRLKQQHEAAQSFEKQKKVQKARRINPSVNEMSERFQGRATGSTEEYYFSDSAPRLDMSRGGKLVFLKLKGAMIRVPASVVAIDAKLEKLWLGCKSVTGMFKRKAKPGEQLDYGDVDAICYLTAKKHIGNSKPYEYVHNFGENGGRKPRLLIDAEGMPILRGGDYKIEDRGIVN